MSVTPALDADDEDEDRELYDALVPRVDAVAGPAHGLGFHILKSRLQGALSKEQQRMTQSLRGRRPVAKAEAAPLPGPIQELLEQLVTAFSAWKDTQSDASGGPVTAGLDQAPDPSEPVEKSIGRSFDRLLEQMPARTADAVRSSVTQAVLGLTLRGGPATLQKAQASGHMAPRDATTVCQRVVLDLAAAHRRRTR